MGRYVLGLFIIGAVFGTLGDFFHVISNTDGYSNPFFPIPFSGQPLWVPVLFGFATLAIVFGHLLADEIVRRFLKIQLKFKRTYFQVMMGCLCFYILYVCSGFIPLATGGARDLVLCLGALLIWSVLDRSPLGLLWGFVTAACGVGVEILLTSSGAFFYFPEAANFWGVPSWLIWLYFAGSVAFANLGRAILHYGVQNVVKAS